MSRAWQIRIYPLILGLTAPQWGCTDPAEHAPRGSVQRPLEIQNTESLGQEAFTESNAKDLAGLAGVNRTPWAEPDRRTKLFPFSFQLTTSEGQPVTSRELLGKPFAVSFLYSRCQNPNKCPKVAENFAKLHERIRAAGLQEKVHLLLVTYDPEHDSPDKFKAFAGRYGLSPDTTTWLVRPDADRKIDFFRALDLPVNFEGNEVNIHGIQLALFDRLGRLTRAYQTVLWDNERVVDDLDRLSKND